MYESKNVVEKIFGISNAKYLYFQYSDLSDTTYPNLSKTVFAIFMVLVPILLLNMLIAMMGNTYAHVIEQSEKEWMKQVIFNSISIYTDAQRHSATELID